MDILRKFLFVVLVSLPVFLAAAQTVNINTADKETLMAVKGVGEKRAEAIIAFREQNGPFKSVDDLLLVKGVGQAIV
ncbi:MAG TPA: ComEA family DNA-binding protein, partial [Gammaproteobacteria bacterium]